MVRLLTLGDLQHRFDEARDKLSSDRKEILALSPLPRKFSHDEYGFSYLRAERLGLYVITQNLNELSWLPVHLDPQDELLLESKKPMQKWLGSPSTEQPDSDVFGNDFIHALTRIALEQGWQSSAFSTAALRIGGLFRDLSCLVGMIYYSVWMAENGIEGVRISDPDNIECMARELAALTRSAEVAQFLGQRKRTAEGKAAEAPPPKKRPHLRVVENAVRARDKPRA